MVFETSQISFRIPKTIHDKIKAYNETTLMKINISKITRILCSIIAEKPERDYEKIMEEIQRRMSLDVTIIPYKNGIKIISDDMFKIVCNLQCDELGRVIKSQSNTQYIFNYVLVNLIDFAEGFDKKTLGLIPVDIIEKNGNINIMCKDKNYEIYIISLTKLTD
jgi:hypothetical protein